jgi:ABC-2 type transport system ATP-binding protein
MKKRKTYSINVKQINAYAGRQQLLFNIKFKVPTGKVCAFIGHNGAGKTTTVKTMLALRPLNIRSKANIRLLCSDFKDYRCRKNIGYIPEKGNNEHITARDFLRYIGYFYGLTNAESDKKMEKIIHFFKLPKNRLKVKMNKLSSGQNKIITICQAFMGKPKLIVADEPTDNLDPETRDMF